MLKFEDIKEHFNKFTLKTSVRELPLENCLNYILAEDIVADTDMPPFNKSAVDGFACKKEDLNSVLEIIEEIPAGKKSEKKIEKNQCAKIMTGAFLPEGADFVFKIEDSQKLSDNEVRYSAESDSPNICYASEDFKKGDVLVKKGSKISESVIASAASVGYRKLKLVKAFNVGIIVTGSELIEPDAKPEPAKIRNSNAYQLMSQLQKMNIEYNYFGIIEDDEQKILNTAKKALKTCDILFLTGGVSVGDYDYMPSVLEKLGLEIIVRRTGCKPGNPMLIALSDNKICFGLSGNPVSSFVQFEVFVKEILFYLQGNKYSPIRIKTIFTENYKRRNADRFGFIPGSINENGVEMSRFNSSAHIEAYTKSNVLIEVPEGVYKIEKGESVYVRPL